MKTLVTWKEGKELLKKNIIRAQTTSVIVWAHYHIWGERESGGVNGGVGKMNIVWSCIDNLFVSIAIFGRCHSCCVHLSDWVGIPLLGMPLLAWGACPLVIDGPIPWLWSSLWTAASTKLTADQEIVDVWEKKLQHTSITTHARMMVPYPIWVRDLICPGHNRATTWVSTKREWHRILTEMW